MSDVADVLERAADLIEPEGAWAQRDYARDGTGRPVDPCDPSAVCWCMNGAIAKATGETVILAEMLIDRLFIPAIPLRRAPVSWNDDACRTQAEVVAALREAAKLAREQPDA